MKRKPRVEGAHYERNYVYNFHFHLIWVTKYRQKAFTTPELVDEMKDILMHIASLNDVEIETMEVMPDHIHMLISFKPKYAPTDQGPGRRRPQGRPGILMGGGNENA